MKRLMLALALLLVLIPPAAGQDFDKGLEAYDRSDYATALREFRPLAENGDPDAQFFLGQLHSFGEGVAQDYKEAVKWYRLAAEQGLDRAQLMLGTMYYGGRSVPQDYAEAVKWYRLAAEQGLDRAQYWLGTMYSGGLGVPQDFVRAHMWMNLAAAQGLEVARILREAIEGIMTRNQVAEAQRLARNWRPGASVAAAAPLSDLTTKAQVRRVQRDLASLAYSPGPPDGILGRKTRKAIRAFQSDYGLAVTGEVSPQLEAAIQKAMSERYNQINSRL